MSSSNLNTNDSTANNGLKPRLCHLRKWSFFQGYGFNLHAEKTRNGQFIGKVDPNSPAEIAGLHEKDRIIEVNYVNISNENHQQVVKRIRNGLEVDGKLIIDEVVLLVVDQETDDSYKKQNKIVRWDDDNVLKMETPREEDLNQMKNKKKIDHIDDLKLEDDNNSNYKHENKSDSSPIVTPIVTPILLKKAVSNDSIGKDSKGKADVDSSSNRDSNLDLNDHNDEPFHMNNEQKKSVSNSPSISDHRIEVIPQNSTLPQTPTLNEKSNSHSNSSTNLNGNNRKSNGSSPLQTPPLVNRSNNSSFSKENKKMTNESTTKLMDNNSITDTTNNNNPNDPFKMSAAEFKNYLKNKHRADPREARVDMKQKFKIFQDM